MAVILGRKTWTTTRAAGSAFNMSQVRGIVCHYPAAGKDIGAVSASSEQSRIRGYRNYHTNGRGWADLGYNYVVTQAGRIYEGRGLRAGAHATGHNSTTVGVLFLVGDNEPLTVEAVTAFKALRKWLQGRGVGSGLWGHQQMAGAATRCPGPYIMGAIRSGELAGAVKSAARPAAKPATSKWVEVSGANPVLREYRKGEPVKRVQAAVGVHQDGFYGPNTKNAVQEYQRRNGLIADGIVGAKTWAQINGNKLGENAAKPKYVFPLPSGHWFGVESANKKNHSGYYKKYRADIKRLQKAVGVKADGVYGPNTRAAVIRFQKSNGLAADGLAGARTWNKLFG